jgi:RHS repeat-associated protein
VIKTGDSEASPSIEYQYNSWGTLNQQHIKTRTKIAGSDYLWQSDYFDGLGRVVQTQGQGETGRTIIQGTITYNSVGLVDKQYVSQDLDSSQVNGYKAPEAGWKCTSYAYDGLGRVTTLTNADGTSINHDYSTAWQDLATNEQGFKKRYFYNAFQRLVEVQELNASHQLYATTSYTYDVLGNLVQVEDNDGNITSMTYDWLSRKTGMTDPDMGTWSYGYNSNGNLTSQTDAKSQTITLTYDALSRLTGKSYPPGLGMTNVTYTYDSTDGGNYGKGLRTGMADALGATSYKYDNRGRLIEEKRTIDSVDYTTQFTYDGADRIATVTYPTEEVVTNGYNGRGLPYSLSGTVAGNLVTSTLYNNLGSITDINLGNGLKTTFGYWDVGGAYDTTGGYYGRLWEIKTLPQAGGNAIQDVQHTWDEGGNLTQRQDVLTSETETFTYDFLDRLTGVSGPYTHSYAYDEIGNITSMNGNSYTYGTKPHAVTAVGATSYAYDDNGNMTTRGSQTLTWDMENRPVTISGGASFVYDGDGNRVKKTEGGETILYVNKYYEKNLTTSEVTTHYYLGDREVAQRKGTTLSYIHQDHLTGTSVTSDSSGASTGTIKYFPFGSTRSGSVCTAKKFTGQRLDETGLYYYGARYYDPEIGRFISTDTIVPSPANPQALNRYSYVLNNPLKYNDPTGQWPSWGDIKEIVSNVINTGKEALQVVVSKTVEVYQAAKQLLGQAQEATMHAAGIVRVEYYTDTRSIKDPVPVYHVGDEGIVPILLGDLSGISLYPIGVFVKEAAYIRDPTILAHESYHYYEQSIWGITIWLAAYYGEMAFDWAYYGGDYWTGPYNVNSREIAARVYAGQPTYPYPISTPWWQQPSGSPNEPLPVYYDPYYDDG